MGSSVRTVVTTTNFYSDLLAPFDGKTFLRPKKDRHKNSQEELHHQVCPVPYRVTMAPSGLRFLGPNNQMERDVFLKNGVPMEKKGAESGSWNGESANSDLGRN